MIGSFLPILFLIFLIYISYKSGFFLMFNYITGSVFLLLFSFFRLQNDPGNKFEILIFFINVFFYTILFASSLYIYFDKENEKKNFFMIPVVSFCVIIFLEAQILNFGKSFSPILPISIAFFPLYFFKYYCKYYKD